MFSMRYSKDGMAQIPWSTHMENDENYDILALKVIFWPASQ